MREKCHDLESQQRGGKKEIETGMLIKNEKTFRKPTIYYIRFSNPPLLAFCTTHSSIKPCQISKMELLVKKLTAGRH